LAEWELRKDAGKLLFIYTAVKITQIPSYLPDRMLCYSAFLRTFDQVVKSQSFVHGSRDSLQCLNYRLDRSGFESWHPIYVFLLLYLMYSYFMFIFLLYVYVCSSHKLALFSYLEWGFSVLFSSVVRQMPG
jgi:hypothetical protein